jgi:hypothetical protein
MKTKVKDSYYFPHYSDARNDDKVIAVRQDHGMAGYGVYFMLLEILRNQGDYKYPISSIPRLEYDVRADTQLIHDIIYNYDLFIIDQDFFYSNRLSMAMEVYNATKQRLREAGKKGGDAKARLKQDGSTDPLPLNERKGNERKLNEMEEKEMVGEESEGKEIEGKEFEENHKEENHRKENLVKKDPDLEYIEWREEMKKQGFK